ncbi:MULTISPECIES: DUF2875 family protein [Rhodanobacteraceae]|uniref:type VI lipase adapter Tla3 domain-containing protein n=1 Tax=Rhodanobacteraceae TaxID=1775411 RepID=UPI0015906664|nr:MULTISPECIES: DUF2875 family protein [Rhodanobacteraceae]
MSIDQRVGILFFFTAYVAVILITSIGLLTFDMYKVEDPTPNKRLIILAKYLFIIPLAWTTFIAAGCTKTASEKQTEEMMLSIRSDQERSLPPHERIMRGTGDRYALELRAVGLNIEDASQDELWKPITSLASIVASVYPPQIEDFPQDEDDRLMQSRIAEASAAQSVGLDAVSDWPIPALAAQPPTPTSAKTSAGEEIGSSLQGASLVYTYAIWIDDLNGEDASPLVDKLFAFFDEHPEVPQVIVMAKDGDTFRDTWTAPGHKRRQGAHIPERLSSFVSLLVTRTDRVDRFIRPYAIKETKGATSPLQTEFDYIKLYNFYWEEDEAYAARRHESYIATTMSASHWASRLPAFLKTIDDKGVPGFKRTNYLPLRWTEWQIDLFDRAPLLGYLHRPITVRLRDDEDKPFDIDAATAALTAGWERAVGTLPAGEAPVRVFRDTRNDHGVTKVLAPILRSQATPINVDNMDQGFDIGVRLGNTGIASPFVQIALGTMASYKLGGATATVHRRENGDVTFTMISPSDPEQKAAWEARSGKKNPFYAHVN